LGGPKGTDKQIPIPWQESARAENEHVGASQGEKARTLMILSSQVVGARGQVGVLAGR